MLYMKTSACFSAAHFSLHINENSVFLYGSFSLFWGKIFIRGNAQVFISPLLSFDNLWNPNPFQDLEHYCQEVPPCSFPVISPSPRTMNVWFSISYHRLILAVLALNINGIVPVHTSSCKTSFILHCIFGIHPYCWVHQ